MKIDKWGKTKCSFKDYLVKNWKNILAYGVIFFIAAFTLLFIYYDNVSKQLDKFNSNDLIALDMRNKMEICIYPIADFLTQYGYIEMLRKEEKDDKFIAGTIESEYDNYFSVEEEADEKEEEIDY